MWFQNEATAQKEDAEESRGEGRGGRAVASVDKIRRRVALKAGVTREKNTRTDMEELFQPDERTVATE